MATNTQSKDTQTAQQDIKKVAKTAEKDVKPLQQFLTKFNNDWVMNFSSALAYNLLMAIFPIAIAVLAILGLIIGNLNPSAYANLTTQLMQAFPGTLSSKGVIDSITMQLHKDSGILGIFAMVLAIFNGSRLFILIEGCFGIIYHVRQRKVIRQNLMAIGMLILFIVLIPIMVFASSLPTLAVTVLQHTSLSGLFSNGFVAFLIGIFSGFIASYILFQAIYLVVPNQHISWRHSWLGSVVAAALMELYLTLFPLYVSHFLTGYAASISTVIILLIFFYYFAVILLLGAEVNAFFSEHVKATPTDIVTMVHITTSHLPKSPEDREQQAAESHKNSTSTKVAKDTHIEDDATANNNTNTKMRTHSASQAIEQSKQQEDTSGSENQRGKRGKKERPKGPSKLVPILEAVTGTALAFFVELFYRRKRT
ncbi:MAG TPA: YihY/virulence factor BrkB family protein [Ktedonobacteraceae bacterium]|nr:YihY/virulence factor BrkB family protein [Ktedonobacteraceae bacterium]